MRKCPACAAKVNDTRHYCPKCGAALIYPPDQDADDGLKTKGKAAKSRLKMVICIICLAALLLFVVFFPRSKGYTSSEALTEEYLALFSAGKSEEIAELFLPELMTAATLETVDAYASLYGISFETVGIYDVTDNSDLNADTMHRLLRNTYGIEPEITGYVSILAGIVANGSDLWLQLDMVSVDGYWYICQVR